MKSIETKEDCFNSKERRKENIEINSSCYGKWTIYSPLSSYKLHISNYK